MPTKESGLDPRLYEERTYYDPIARKEIRSGMYRLKKEDKPLVTVNTGDQPKYEADDASEYAKSEGRLVEYENFLSRLDDPEFAKRFDNEAGYEGFTKSLLRNFFGDTNDIDAARRNFIRYVNEDLLSALPSGPQSDRDIIIFSQGFPDKFVNAESAKSYMRGLYKSQYMRSRFLEFQAAMRPKVLAGEISNHQVLKLWKDQYAKQAMAEISQKYPPPQSPADAENPDDAGEGYEIL
jgi:hypothetical protein